MASRGWRRKGALCMHSGLVGLSTQPTNLCRLSLGHLETGPSEVLLQWVPLSPLPSPSGHSAFLTSLPDQTCLASWTANSLWPLDLWDPQPYFPGHSFFSSQAQEPSPQPGLTAWIRLLGKSPFHISSDWNTPTSQGPASVLSFLSILPTPTRSLDTSRTLPCHPRLLHVLLLPSYYLFTRTWRISLSTS